MRKRTRVLIDVIIATIAIVIILSLSGCQGGRFNLDDSKYWKLEMALFGSVRPDIDDDHECLEAGCANYPIITIRDGKPTGEYQRIYGDQ
tara:strand:+ start:1189 stop:1458 length:270 start_codon:yes stop_codon:yes gene_type:complete